MTTPQVKQQKYQNRMKFYQKICLAALATTATLAALTKGPNRNVNDMETLAKTLYPGHTTKVSEMKTETESWRIDGDKVVLLPEEIDLFHKQGYITLPPILSPTELQDIRDEYNKFLTKEKTVPGRDFGDMSVSFDTPVEEYNMLNVLLPRHYYPDWKNNLYERRAKSISDQLYNSNLAIDYDQILAKLPGKANGKFVWHQDMGYWPDPSDDKGRPTTTATVSLALNDAVVENGCLVVVGGSGVTKRDSIRKHKPLMSKKEVPHSENENIGKTDGVAVAENHALVVTLDQEDQVTFLPVAAGGVTVHDEWILHGSGGNHDKENWRHTYVLAYREPTMIEWERSLGEEGFRHSHNDKFQWDSFKKENLQHEL